MDLIGYLETVTGDWPVRCPRTFAGAARELARQLRVYQASDDPVERAQFWAWQRELMGAEKRA